MFRVILSGFLLIHTRNIVGQSRERPSLVPDGSIKVGKSCSRDVQCIKNAFCRFQQMCSCEPTYLPGLDKAACHASNATFCSSEADCSTMSNAECIRNACQCRSTFNLDLKNTSNCISKPKIAGDRCQTTPECMETLLKAHCHNTECVCFGGHRFINTTGGCVPMRGMYQSCSHNYECYEGENVKDLECRDGECVYKDIAVSGPVPTLAVPLTLLTLIFGPLFTKISSL